MGGGGLVMPLIDTVTHMYNNVKRMGKVILVTHRELRAVKVYTNSDMLMIRSQSFRNE